MLHFRHRTFGRSGLRQYTRVFPKPRSYIPYSLCTLKKPHIRLISVLTASKSDASLPVTHPSNVSFHLPRKRRCPSSIGTRRFTLRFEELQSRSGLHVHVRVAGSFKEDQTHRRGARHAAHRDRRDGRRQWPRRSNEDSGREGKGGDSGTPE